MVYEYNKDGEKIKLACMKCIKGHRSSKCKHKERELHEIKKKGRPISQCKQCRLLRQTKGVHVKCQCHIYLKENTQQVYNQLNSILCRQCNQTRCICLEDSFRPEYSSSSDGFLTPPTMYSNYPESLPSTPKSNNTQPNELIEDLIDQNLPRPLLHRLIIPIHDPTDDIDSDTPVYKSIENNHDHPNLGEFITEKSEELITQICSGIHLSPSPNLNDDQLIELSKDP